MHYAYLDESGNVDYFNPAEYFLVAALLGADAGGVRAVEQHVKREREKLRQRPRVELKASLAATEGRGIVRLLQALAREDIAVMAVILDKRFVCRVPDDPEEWYRQTVSRTVRHCAARWPDLGKVVLDKRYTNRRLRDRLTVAIRSSIVGLARPDVPILQVDSQSARCLQAVDYVAWAIRQKYEKGDSQYYELLKDVLVVEEVVRAQ